VVREALAAHRVLWLDVGLEQAWARASGRDRPLARDRERFAELHAERTPLYEEVADGVVPAAVLERALPAVLAWTKAPAGTQLVWATSASAEYPVFAGEGILEAGFYPVPGRRFLVTDGQVARWYAGLLEPLLGTASIMPGEASKTVAHAEIVWTEMATAGVTRDDHVAALGGGVVGDLAGFCAATYQRGIGIVHVPTTVVAQVDSAYGGKTAVDLAEAKNYVGAYHQPSAVLTDPATLRTLPAEERAAGYAEVVKTALIAGGELWERVRSGASDGTDLDTIVACARTKLAVVAADERDAGARQVLNLGHTVAHAIETATGYARYRHGEAVALGLLAALRLSDQENLREEVAGLLDSHGLPTRLADEVDLEAVERATARDKKRRGEGPVPFVLVEAPGTVSPGHAVEPGALRAALRELAP
jgi:shikimate kinase / 3-dehydroquinate synthase